MCLPCPIPRGQSQAGAAWLSGTWVEGGSFQPAFLLYCVVLTQVEPYIHHVDTNSLCFPSLVLLELNANPPKLFFVCIWTPAFLSPWAVNSREKVEKEKTQECSPAASILHPTRESWKELISNFEKIHKNEPCQGFHAPCLFLRELELALYHQWHERTSRPPSHLIEDSFST